MIPSSVDVLIVGAGPAGSTTARYAAQHGLQVLLVDKRQELGAPIQCSGAVSAHALAVVGVIPAEEFISTSIYGFRIYDSVGNATHIDYRELKPQPYQEQPLGYVVDRRRFDRYLMNRAKRAGAEVWLKTEALGFDRLDAQSLEVRLKQFGTEQIVRTRILVGADGVQSQVGKWAGLRTHIRLAEIASCLQYVMDGVETEGLLEIITGHRWAPGGYGWVFPKGKGYAEVGLGVIRTITEKDARWHLDNFLKNSPLAKRFQNGHIIEVQGGGVPLAAPLKRQYADNLILVGDAARHVNPITGGGIHTALESGMIAGRFLGEFFQKNQPATSENLSGYQQRWEEAMGTAMRKIYRLKREIFRKPLPERDRLLYETLANYFQPDSEFKKV